MTAQRFDAVVFDFDYTLADSSDAIVECVNTALRGMGFCDAEPAAIRRTIGLPLKDTFMRLTEHAAPERGDEFVRRFVARADDVMVAWTVVFEQTPRMLESLKTLGLKVGIVSTKYRYRIADILKREGLLEAFDIIVGGEDVAVHKPHPDGLLQAVRGLETGVERALYVGDSTVDAETAHRAATAFAAVLTGMTPREAFAEYAPDAVLEHVGELAEWLRGRA